MSVTLINNVPCKKKKIQNENINAIQENTSVNKSVFVTCA